MAEIRPFACVRPCREKAARIAALPYDVYNRKEAKEEVLREPDSFLKIDRAETQFDDSVDIYTPEVYQKAHDMLWDMIAKGDFIRDKKFYSLKSYTSCQIKSTVFLLIRWRSVHPFLRPALCASTA